jgi:DNA-binding CsgD family transcriptional regulator
MSMAKNQPSEEHGLPSLSLVFGYIAVKELQLLEDRVRVLARLGYGNAEIATICDTKPTVVRTLKSRARRKSTKKS